MAKDPDLERTEEETNGRGGELDVGVSSRGALALLSRPSNGKTKPGWVPTWQPRAPRGCMVQGLGHDTVKGGGMVAWKTMFWQPTWHISLWHGCQRTNNNTQFPVTGKQAGLRKAWRI